MSFMTRSRKLSGKLTTKQIQGEVDEVKNVVNQLIGAVGQDMARLNGLIYALLSEMDLLDETNCPHCGQVLYEPRLKMLDKQEDCPACGKKIQDNQGKITDYETWDNGGEEE